jgi:hypothetical protein
METFYEWLPRASLLARLRLLETYYTFDRQAYDRLFDEELRKVLARTTDPAHRQALDRMKGFRWMGYIAVAIKRAGFHDEREIQERSHDIAAQLLLSTLFTGFDQTVSGPFDLRFKASLRNAILNMVEKEKTRKRLIPTVRIGEEPEPSRSPETGDDDGKIIHDFRQLVRRRLGGLGVAVLDMRLAGGETKSLVGRPELGFADKNVIKKVVQQVKALAREYALRLGDPAFLRDIERAMGREAATVGKRRAAMAGRRAAVA